MPEARGDIISWDAQKNVLVSEKQLQTRQTDGFLHGFDIVVVPAEVLNAELNPIALFVSFCGLSSCHHGQLMRSRWLAAGQNRKMDENGSCPITARATPQCRSLRWPDWSCQDFGLRP